MRTGPPSKEEDLENPVLKPTEEAQSSKLQTFGNVSQGEVTKARGMIMYFCRHGRFFFRDFSYQVLSIVYLFKVNSKCTRTASMNLDLTYLYLALNILFIVSSSENRIT